MKTEKEKKIRNHLESKATSSVIRKVISDVEKTIPVMYDTSFCHDNECGTCLSQEGCKLVSFKLGILFCVSMLEMKEYKKCEERLASLYKMI